MFIRGLLVLFVFRDCLCIRLPGLYDVNQSIGTEDGPSAYLPFSSTGSTADIKPPAFRDSISEELYDVFTGKPDRDTGSSTTAARSYEQGSAKETSMEQLLDKIFGNQSWKSLLPNSETPTTTKQTMVGNTNGIASSGLPRGSGFFSNQLSAGQLFNGDETGKSQLTTIPNRTHKDDNSKPLDKISSSGHLKAGLKYTGSFVNTNIHSYKNEKTASNSHPSGTTIRNPATLPPPHMYNMQANGQPGPFGHQENDNDAFGTEMFDPNTVNNLLTSYNPYSNSAAFATQTGSNPLNANLRVNFDADKINTKYMDENSERTLNNVPPGVVSLPTGAGGGASDESTNKLPQFDANKINENLLERNWMFSDKPVNAIAPAFLTGNVNRQVSILANHDTNQDMSRKQQHIFQGTASHDPASNFDKNEQVIVASSQVSTDSKPQFNFVPGNLYPGVSQNHDNHRSQNNIPSIAIPVFDPNSVNSQQVRFNPNSISWIQKRDIKERSIDERKLNGNRLVQDKDLFGRSNSSYPNDNFRKDGAYIINGSNTKDSFGNPQGVTRAPLSNHDNNALYSGFNPNKLNTEQGRNNFVPGQMSPYDSSPHQYLNSETDISTFYRPNNTSAKLLNFDIGSLLGIGNVNSTGGIGFTGAFNPTSLNKMMMTTFSENLRNKTGRNETNAQSFVTSYDPNSSKLAAFKDTGSFTNFGYGSDISSNSSTFSQGAINIQGFMNGGFDPNAANVGFGDVLKGGGSSGFEFGTSTSSNSSEPSKGLGGFGSGGGFDANAANVGFGATDYGMGGLGGPIGAFGGSFNADTMNAGLLGRSNSTSVKDLVSYFLGAKMKVEGGLNNGEEGGLFDSRYVGSFDPDSVNHVSYDPNQYNNVKIHFNPSDMLMRNPGMDKDTLESSGNLFDPDKVNSLLKQQSFNPEAMLQYIPGISDTEIPQQTGGLYEGSTKDPGLFDPFETMKKLMSSSFSFIPGHISHTTTTASTIMSTPKDVNSSSNASLFGNAPSETPMTTSSKINLTSTTNPVISSSFQTGSGGSFTETSSSVTQSSLTENSTDTNN